MKENQILKLISSMMFRYVIFAGCLVNICIDPISGEIYTRGKIDREENDVIDFAVRAIDTKSAIRASGEYFYSDQNVKIRVKDKNDNSPVFEHQAVQLVLPENSKIGTVIGKVRATDADEGPNGDVRYVIYDSSPQNYVTLDEKHGTLKLNRDVDFEALRHIDVVVMAQDSPVNGESPRMSFANVVIRILDENDNAPIFHPPFAVTISEDHDPTFSFFKVSLIWLDKLDESICSIRLLCA